MISDCVFLMYHSKYDDMIYSRVRQLLDMDMHTCFVFLRVVILHTTGKSLFGPYIYITHVPVFKLPLYYIVNFVFFIFCEVEPG